MKETKNTKKSKVSFKDLLDTAYLSLIVGVIANGIYTYII